MLSTLLIFAFLASGCDFMQTVVHTGPKNGVYLIPDGYVGPVIIVFDQSDGVVPDVESGYFVYNIPPDGILRVRTPPYSGLVDYSFFYVDSDKSRKKINYLEITGDRDPQGLPQNKYGNISQDEVENSIFVMVHRNGSFKANGKSVQLTSCVVGRPKDSVDLADKMYEKITNLQRSFNETPN